MIESKEVNVFTVLIMQIHVWVCANICVCVYQSFYHENAEKQRLRRTAFVSLKSDMLQKKTNIKKNNNPIVKDSRNPEQ